MPPEQADSSELTAAADVYALGVTVFQMLTGRVPFEGSTTQILIAHAMQPIPNIRDYRPSLSPETQNVINKAMAKNPAERYSSAGKLAQGLRVALEGSRAVAASEAPQNALLMTNMLGQVIFVDHHCLSMLRIPQSEARTIIGKGLDDVLGVTPQVAQQLIKDVSALGQIDSRKVDAKDAEGDTYDNKKNFVGSDFTLKPIWPGVEETKIIESPSQVEKLDSTEESYLQVYFTTQYGALQKLLTQVGGKRLSEHLDKIINETAERNVWPVKAQNGQLTINLKSSDADSYRALLAKSVTYANMVIGDRIVAREMNAVDAKMNPKILEYVQAFRLR
jgi:hypothetical protein